MAGAFTENKIPYQRKASIAILLLLNHLPGRKSKWERYFFKKKLHWDGRWNGLPGNFNWVTATVEIAAHYSGWLIGALALGAVLDIFRRERKIF